MSQLMTADPATSGDDADPGRTPGRTPGFGWLVGRASEIAPRLLGATLACGPRAGIIVEVEAYEGRDDPASHAFRGPTPRSRVMFDRAGLLYVYRSYGVHWCANVVCGPVDQGSALLVRAIEPTAGIELMWADRPKARRQTDLGSGPGKLCAALGIDASHYGVDLLDPASAVRLVDGPGPEGREVISGPRIGISKATERPWRFALAGHPHLSRPLP
jgi:DNA-3-methyladenine glycosylase